MYQLKGLHWSRCLRASLSVILQRRRVRGGEGGGGGGGGAVATDLLSIFNFQREGVSLIEKRLVIVQPHLNCPSYVPVEHRRTSRFQTSQNARKTVFSLLFSTTKLS